jgi:hypothetical protein
MALDKRAGNLMSEAPKNQEFDFTSRAMEIVQAAKERGVELRIMGAIAYRLHCEKFLYLYSELKREPTDIDFASYSKYRSDITKLITEHGFVPDERFMSLHGEKRHIYYDTGGRHLDVFLDELDMCHRISFKGLLEKDFPTLTPALLSLEKLQIVEITEKDLKDLTVLFREHEVGETDDDEINGKFVAELLAGDWGFYQTAMTNLGKLRESLDLLTT